MSHSEQLEQETEQTRAQIADTLDELRACMTPGRVLDQLADRVSDGAPAAFARNLKDQAVNNPIPVALIGAGLAWLMMGSRGNSGGGFMQGAASAVGDIARGAADTMRSAANDASSTASDKSAAWQDRASKAGTAAGRRMSRMADRARQAASNTGTRLRDAAGSVTESVEDSREGAVDSMRATAGSMADSMRRAATEQYEGMADTARRTAASLSESTKAAGQQMLQSGGTFADFCREQPLMLAGLGIALGAMIGALLPATEAEDRLMGEASDQVKERAQDIATDQYESAKEIGEHVVEAGREEANKQASNEHEADSTQREAKANEATLAPAQPSEEALGQPWSAQNAPL